jgi:hypothetical protein
MRVTRPLARGDGRRKALQDIVAGSVMETFVAAPAFVLAALGLVGVLPAFFTAIATIAVGAGLLFAGTGVAARYADMAPEMGDTPVHAAELNGGMTAEFTAGVSGITLGILALLHVSPSVLLASAIVVFGAGLLLGAGVTSRINALRAEYAAADGGAHRLAREAVATAVCTEALVGIGAAALGALALEGIAWMPLIPVALLGVSGTLLLGGTATWGRARAALRR